MIPLLEEVLPTQDPLLRAGHLRIMKLHNGVGFRRPKVCFFVFQDGRPVSILKTVRSAHNRAITESAFANLRLAEEVCAKARLNMLIPHASWITDIAGVPVSAETFVSGRPMNPANSLERSMAIERLVQLESATTQGVRALDDMRLFVQECIDRLQSQHTNLLDLLHRSCASMLDACASNTIFPNVRSHGDATPSNMLWLEKGGIGMIDWDGFGEITLPLFDLFTFLERATPKGGNLFTLYRMEIESTALAHNIDRSALPLLGLLALVMTDIRKRSFHFSWELPLWDQDLYLLCQERLRQMHDAWPVALNT